MNMLLSRPTFAVISALAMLTLAAPSSAQQTTAPAAPSAPAVQQAPAVSQTPAAPVQAVQPAQAPRRRVQTQPPRQPSVKANC
jgi:biopolymer transport protein ExbB